MGRSEVVNSVIIDNDLAKKIMSRKEKKVTIILQIPQIVTAFTNSFDTLKNSRKKFLLYFSLIVSNHE